MTVVLVILLLFCVFILCIVVAPLRVRAEFTLNGERYEYRLGFSWIHRAVCRGSYASDDFRWRVKVLFWGLPTERSTERERPRESSENPSSVPAGEFTDAHASQPTRPRSALLPPVPQPVPEHYELPPKTEKETQQPSETTPPKTAPSAMRFFLLQSAWRRKVLRCARRALSGFVSLIRVMHLSINVHGGNGDPCMSGVAAGAVTALVYSLGLQRCRRLQLTYVPVFDQPYLHATGTIVASTSLARLFRPLVRLVLSFPYFTTLLTWMRWRRERENRGTRQR